MGKPMVDYDGNNINSGLTRQQLILVVNLDTQISV